MKYNSLFFIFVYYNSNFIIYGSASIVQYASAAFDQLSVSLINNFKDNLKNLNTINGLENKNSLIKDGESINTDITFIRAETNQNQHVNYHKVIDIVMFCHITHILSSSTCLQYKIKFLLDSIRNVFLIILCILMIINILYVHPIITLIIIGVLIILKYLIKLTDEMIIVILTISFIACIIFNIIPLMNISGVNISSISLLFIGIACFNILSSLLLTNTTSPAPNQEVKISKVFYLSFTAIQIMFFSCVFYFDSSFYITLLFQIILFTLMMKFTSEHNSNRMKNILLITLANTSCVLYFISFKLPWNVFTHLMIIQDIWNYLYKNQNEKVRDNIETPTKTEAIQEITNDSSSKITNDSSPQINEIIHMDSINYASYMIYTSVVVCAVLAIYYIYTINTNNINHNHNNVTSSNDVINHNTSIITNKIKTRNNYKTYIVITGIICAVTGAFIKYTK